MGGRDDPHKEDKIKIGEIFGFGVEIYIKTAIEDIPHYSTHVHFPFVNGEVKYNHSPFNHFIDIKKERGRFDDFDGYSYELGSARHDQHEKEKGEYIDWWVTWWFNDELFSFN